MWNDTLLAQFKQAFTPTVVDSSPCGAPEAGVTSVKPVCYLRQGEWQSLPMSPIKSAYTQVTTSPLRQCPQVAHSQSKAISKMDKVRALEDEFRIYQYKIPSVRSGSYRMSVPVRFEYRRLSKNIEQLEQDYPLTKTEQRRLEVYRKRLCNLLKMNSNAAHNCRYPFLCAVQIGWHQREECSTALFRIMDEVSLICQDNYDSKEISECELHEKKNILACWLGKLALLTSFGSKREFFKEMNEDGKIIFGCSPISLFFSDEYKNTKMWRDGADMFEDLIAEIRKKASMWRM